MRSSGLGSNQIGLVASWEVEGREIPSPLLSFLHFSPLFSFLVPLSALSFPFSSPLPFSFNRGGLKMKRDTGTNYRLFLFPGNEWKDSVISSWKLFSLPIWLYSQFHPCNRVCSPRGSLSCVVLFDQVMDHLNFMFKSQYVALIVLNHVLMIDGLLCHTIKNFLAS